MDNHRLKKIILGIVVVIIALITINAAIGGSTTKNLNTAGAKINAVTHKKHELISISEVQKMLAENPVYVISI